MTKAQAIFQALASRIAKREGLKTQSSIGNVREQLSITIDELRQLPADQLGALLAMPPKR